MDDFSFRDDDFDAPEESRWAENALDLSGLNPAQRSAVETLEGPLLILAGPGSGKTRVVTHRIANLLHQGVSDRNVLAVTFTNKAADEMKHRVRRLAPGASVWVSTFHRFCSRMLREHASLVGLRENFSILDTTDSGKILTEVVALEEDEELMGDVRKVANIISMAKNNLLSPEKFAEGAKPGDERLAAKLYPRYQEALQTSNAVDFDDLLMYVAELLRDNQELTAALDAQYRYVMVDEYQDTNLAQYVIVRSLSQRYPNLAVTGDPDQSIYGWRGASIANIMNFEQDFPSAKVVRLEQNYRSSPNILRCADSLISHNLKRKPKSLVTDRDEGSRVRLAIYPTYVDEAHDIVKRISDELASGNRRPSEIAVFYRVHSLSRLVERLLMEHGVAYRVLNGAAFFQRAEVKDVVAFLHLLNNPANGAAFLRIVNTPARGIGKKTLERLIDHARDRHISLMEAAREAGMINGLAKRAVMALARFVTMYDEMHEHVTEPVEVLVKIVLERSGYEKHVEEVGEADGTERAANVRELINSAREFDEANHHDGSLEAYLEQVSLVSDTDGLDGEASAEAVTLMSLHSAKGLEYESVYVMALEEEFVPHRRSRENQDDLEEERRLLFVGITRAKEELHLSLAGYRMKRGSNMPTVPSQFLQELPKHEMELIDLTAMRRGPHGSSDPYAQDIDSEFAYQQDWTPGSANSDATADTSFDPIALEAMEQEAVETGANPGGLEAAKVLTAAELMRSSSSDQEHASEPGEPKLVLDEEHAATTSEPVYDESLWVREPSELSPGAVVSHPDIGAGAVVACTGKGRKAKVVIRFFGEAAPRSFYLAHARLQLVRSGD